MSVQLYLVAICFVFCGLLLAAKYAAPELYTGLTGCYAQINDGEVSEKYGELCEAATSYAGKLKKDIGDKIFKNSGESSVAVLAQTDYGFLLPLDAMNVSGSFGFRTDPIDGEMRFHSGADLSAAEGTNVYAAASGIVVYCGALGDYGSVIKIKHSDELSTLYAHLSKTLTYNGAFVQRGALIGLVGQTGRATGPHLHFEVIKNGYRIDPMSFLGAA